jgi:hypothetical protein
MSLRGAKRRSNPVGLCRATDCFAEPVIGPHFARTRWLAMTKGDYSFVSEISGASGRFMPTT